MTQMLKDNTHEMARILNHCLQIVNDLQVKPASNQPSAVNTPITTTASTTTSTQQECSSRRTRDPSEIITCFLSEVLVWMLVRCADGAQSRVLRENMQEGNVNAVGGFFAAVAGALDETIRGNNTDNSGGSDGRRTSRANSVLFAAADVLSEMAPWTASLNLALLLCHRGKEGVGGGSL
jgi:hypothetical protein